VTTNEDGAPLGESVTAKPEGSGQGSPPPDCPEASDGWQRLAILAENERRFRTVAQATQDMVTETDYASGEFTYVSGAVETVLGGPRVNKKDTRAVALHHPGEASIFLKHVRGSSEGEPFHVPPHRLKKRDGGWAWVEATGLRYRRSGGEVRIMGVARDITARREAEQVRSELEARLQRIQHLESLGILAGGIAHDFNNLLTPILGRVGLLLADLPQDAATRGHVETIRLAASQARALTDQMLAYVGETPFKLDAVDLPRVVNEMRVLTETGKRTVTFAYSQAEDVPTVHGDGGQIGQVVLNLISNASEALDSKGGRIEVSTQRVIGDRATLDACYFGEILPEGDYACLRVRDDGCGISEESVDRVFDPFFTTKFTGRGLGLAVVLGIVRRHRGCMRVQSRLGEGTTFDVLLPAMDRTALLASRVEADEAPPVEASQVAAVDGAILVVDDDDGARELAVLVLERAGFSVLAAASGREAVELFGRQGEEIAGVVLDGTMPGLSGAEVFDAIRSQDAQARVLLVSGYAPGRDAEALFERGLASFLQKPFDAEALVAAVRRLVA